MAHRTHAAGPRSAPIAARRGGTLLALLLLLTLVACAGAEDDPPGGAVEPDPEPVEPPDPDASDEAQPPEDPEEEEEVDAEEPPPGVDAVRVWVVRAEVDRAGLVSERRDLAAPTQAVATAALTELFEVDPVDPAHTAPAGTATTVRSVTLADGLLTVDVDAALAEVGGGAEAEALLAGAVASTATQFPTVDAVLLTVDGAPVEELWGHLDWSEPLTPAPDLLAPIDVTSPQWGDTHERGAPLEVRGDASVFEGTVLLELSDPDGAVVEETFTTAEVDDVGFRGRFSLVFAAVPDRAGTWRVRVAEPRIAEDEGFEPAVVDIEIEVD